MSYLQTAWRLTQAMRMVPRLHITACSHIVWRAAGPVMSCEMLVWCRHPLKQTYIAELNVVPLSRPHHSFQNNQKVRWHPVFIFFIFLLEGNNYIIVPLASSPQPLSCLYALQDKSRKITISQQKWSMWNVHPGGFISGAVGPTGGGCCSQLNGQQDATSLWMPGRAPCHITLLSQGPRHAYKREEEAWHGWHGPVHHHTQEAASQCECDFLTHTGMFCLCSLWWGSQRPATLFGSPISRHGV